MHSVWFAPSPYSRIMSSTGMPDRIAATRPRDLFPCQAGEDEAVDDSRGFLVVHADAGRIVKPDRSVRRGLSKTAAGLFLEGRGHGGPGRSSPR